MWREIATGATIGAACFIAGYLSGSERTIVIHRKQSRGQSLGWDDVNLRRW